LVPSEFLCGKKMVVVLVVLVAAIAVEAVATV
jgi:hypothetical protein